MIVVSAALALVPVLSFGQAPQRSVLVVYSGESGYSTGGTVSSMALVDVAIERMLTARLDDLLYYSEHIDTTRLQDQAYVEDVGSLLRSKYADRKLDLILVLGDVAADFVAKQRAGLFPDVPVVSFSADPVAAIHNATGVVGPIKQRKVLDTALGLHPDTRHVAIVAGTTAYDQYYVNSARREFKPFEGRLAFTYLTDLPLRELLRRVASLPPQTIILFMGVTRDADGRLFLPQEVLKSITTAANAPTYGWNGAGLGNGLVGGTVYTQEAVAASVTAPGLRVLNGERVEAIPTTEVDWTATQFDWRELQRWRIDERRLPVNSTILFRQPTAWQSYRRYILGGGLILMLQTGLIVGLVVQRARRRRTELALRESERHFHVMADTAPVMIWRSGTDKACDFFSKPWLDFRGRTFEAEQGSGWMDGVHPDHRARCAQVYLEAFQSRQPFSMEYRLCRADGVYRWVVHLGVPRYDDAGLFAGYIGSAIDISERKRIEAQNQELAGRLISVQEEERSRVARELHDDVSQQMALLAIELQRLGASSPEETPARLLARKALGRAQDIAKSVHDLSHRLHPAKLQLVGLVPALGGLQREQSRPGLSVTFTHESVPERIPPVLTLCLYRIAQESMQNAIKHGAADEITLNLSGSIHRVCLTVVDNGAGFDVDAVWGKGLGLISMRERLEPLGGALTIQSKPGDGTRVVAVAPIAPVPAEG